MTRQRATLLAALLTALTTTGCGPLDPDIQVSDGCKNHEGVDDSWDVTGTTFGTAVVICRDGSIVRVER